MKALLKPLLALLVFGASLAGHAAGEDFVVLVRRESLKDNLVTGSIHANGERLGTCYERNDLRIQAGSYPGYLRYGSQKNFAQGPFGEMGQTGDFLLEIGQVTWSDGKKRTNLLFHGGNKPEQSLGCIMLGPVTRDPDGKPVLGPDHPLRLLRLRFYGTDNPISSPNRRVMIVIEDIPPAK